MRARTLVLSAGLVWGGLVFAGLTPALAQLSGGVGSSNAANQAFQQQNAFRGLQQQQTFNNNESLSRDRTNQLYNNTYAGPRGDYIRRRRR